MNHSVTLYPSNWLYNAGVIGFLMCLEDMGINVESLLRNDGTLVFNLEEIISKADEKVSLSDEKNTFYIPLPLIYFSFVRQSAYLYLNDVLEFDYKEIKKISWNSETLFEYSKSEIEKLDKTDIINCVKRGDCNAKIFAFLHYRVASNLFSRTKIYQNYIAPRLLKELDKFCNKFTEKVNEIRNIEPCDYECCSLCGNFKPKEKLEQKFAGNLMSAKDALPNAFWNLSHSPRICHLCAFLLIHQHLAFTKLPDNSEIFINSPSFKVMYYLNRFTKQFVGEKDIRRLLAMSIIEYQVKLQTTISKWSLMNLEIVVKKGDKVSFIAVPYETIRILNDSTIASLIKDIGQTSILEIVLNREYEKLNEISYHLIRTRFGDERAKEYVKSYIKFKDENRINYQDLLNKISKLYLKIKSLEEQYAEKVH